MNNILYRVHRWFFVSYSVSIVCGFLAIGIFCWAYGSGPKEPLQVGWLVFYVIEGIAMPLAAFHSIAARGAKNGRTYGRVMSFVFGSIVIFGFPIGTVVAIVVFVNAGFRWQSAGLSEGPIQDPLQESGSRQRIAPRPPVPIATQIAAHIPVVNVRNLAAATKIKSRVAIACGTGLAATLCVVMAYIYISHREKPSFRDCNDCPEMVTVPRGSFEMGSPFHQGGQSSHEMAPHDVRIDYSFDFGKFQVTRGQFRVFAEATGYQAQNCWALRRGVQVLKLISPGAPESGALPSSSEMGGNGAASSDGAQTTWSNPGFPQNDNEPVVCIGWADAQAYIEWLSRKTGHRYRLPSEAEWEYAARAGASIEKFWADSIMSTQRQCKYANGADASYRREFPDSSAAPCDDGYAFTSPVGSFQPNAFGLYDMLGNAWEWMQDCYDSGNADEPTNGSAQQGCTAESRRVLRGGSWYVGPQFLRSRIGLDPTSRDNGFGFRVVRTEN